MRIIEALETKERAKINKINLPQTYNAGCTYFQAVNHVFKEYLVFQAHQILPEHINATYSRPQNNPFSQTYKSGWRNHLNFS